MPKEISVSVAYFSTGDPVLNVIEPMGFLVITGCFKHTCISQVNEEILIEMKAIGLNFADLMRRNGIPSS